MGETGRHLGSFELAERLGVTKQRLYVLMKTYDDFPAPTDTLRAGPVWHAIDVDRWLKRHPERPSGQHLRRTQ